MLETGVGRVRATPRAIAMIERLKEEHGDLVFLQSAGCCDGSAPFCARRGTLRIGSGDLLVGWVAGVEFYVNADQYDRWGKPEFHIDVADGAGDSLSLEGTEGVHFVLVTSHDKAHPPRARLTL